MNATQLIARKRDGGVLTADEIDWLVAGFVRGDVPDYQMSAFAMAVYLRGMRDEETAALTASMLDSGARLAWPAGLPRVDKHSTGGIGDKVSLILAPLLACCGVQVPMISGRGLGPTGGTLDKLESIPGFRTDLTRAEFQDICQRIGCVIAGATSDLVPADRKLYALRDVTATVSSIPLITASIMSKKLAEGLSALVLDVKCGSGAFMKTRQDARELTRSLVAVGRSLHLPTTALITEMQQPLGRFAGNAVEVDESVDVLQGNGPADVRELTLALAAEGLLLAGVCDFREQALTRLRSQLDAGHAFERFRAMVTAQGGDPDAPRPRAPGHDVPAAHGGTVLAIDTQALGYAVIELGGGRKVQSDRIDFSVGIEMLVRIGERVERGHPVMRVFARPDRAADVLPRLTQAFRIGPDPIVAPPLILERLTE